MKYLICILLIAIVLWLLWLLISDIVNDIQRTRRYRKYIDSIRVGDIFEPNFVEDLDDDPFEEKSDYSEYSKVIIGIKKNNKGETWVKYKYLNPKYEVEYEVKGTSEIHKFVKNHKRLKQSEI